jgi:Tol biopolymer transport system component
MGDVYRARDTRLDRSVAIKIVRTSFSERFEREAKSISALNHPNICTLHDVGNQDGVSYLVMELVEGSPISGPMPIADVIKFGTQICDALEAAHRKAIVHRDLKPANILATKAGIKLLDFGLAKLQPSPAVQAGEDATVAALTGAHTIVGTPQYMAPEQIEGRDADARTDIFALGCVLYELITGKRAFDGKTASNAMAAVLATEPRKPSELVPVTPASLEWVVLRCLEKDPDKRWQSARDVALQLAWVASQPAETSGPKPGHRRAMVTGVALGAAIAGVATAAWLWPRTGSSGVASPGDQPSINLTALLPADTNLTVTGARPDIAISPDGRLIAFSAWTKDDSAIFLRPIDRSDAVQVAGTKGGKNPFFSPKGDWIAFAIDTTLYKIPVGGGAPIEICALSGLRGAVWMPDDTIVLSPAATSPLMRVSANGGTPTALTSLDTAQNERTHRSPSVLPGGRSLLFVIGNNEIDTYDEARIAALNLDSGKVTEILKGGYSPAYSPTGHLLYMHDESLFAVSFDPATLKSSGSPVQVTKDLASLGSYGTAEFAIAPTGTLIYAPGGDRSSLMSLFWMNRDGTTGPQIGEEQAWSQLRVSPDSRRFSAMLIRANNVLWTSDADRTQMSRQTYRFDVENPTWGPGNDQITFWTGHEVRTVTVDASGSDKVVIPQSVANGRALYPDSWSPDGETLALTVMARGAGGDIALYPVKGAQLKMLIATRFDEFNPRYSPDGKWLAFVSDKSGRYQVYVRNVEGPDRDFPVSLDGSANVWWTSNSRELIFESRDDLMSASFTPGPTPQIGKPVVLRLPDESARRIQAFAPAPDGKRFAVGFGRQLPPLTQIRVVTDWRR